jgi:type VI secretion system protein ImpA
MAPASFDMKKLLKPISRKTPAGEDLRYTGVYDEIREARRAEHPLTQGPWKTDIKSADWKRVIALCSEALIHRSKDLQIGCWLTEALLNRDGYDGLSTGLRYLTELIGRYWESLFPAMEDGDLEYRIGPLAFLDEKLPEALVQVPLCDPAKTRGYSYFDWEESRRTEESTKGQQAQRLRTPAEGEPVTADGFTSAVNLSAIAFYRRLGDQLDRCQRDLKALETVVDEKFSPDPPGFTRIGKALDACSLLVAQILREKQKSEVSRQEEMEILPKPETPKTEAKTEAPAPDESPPAVPPTVLTDQWLMSQRAISDISGEEKRLWRQVSGKLSDGQLKSALDQLLAAASLAPSVREKNRNLLLVAKLCLKAGRPDLALPLVEGLHELIESLHLDQWEHPAWIAEVVETLYRCLKTDSQEEDSERTRQLFRKLCTLNITKAAAYRIE